MNDMDEELAPGEDIDGGVPAPSTGEGPFAIEVHHLSKSFAGKGSPWLSLRGNRIWTRYMANPC